MRILILILALFAAGDTFGQVAARVSTGRSQPSPNRIPRYHNHPITPLLFEDFENPTGYDLFGWGEDTAGGSVVNEDYTSVVLYGTQSLLVEEGEDDQTRATNSFVASSHVFLAFRIRFTSLPDSTDSTFLRLNNAAGDCQIRLTANSDSEMRVQFACTGTLYQMPMTIAVNTTYTIWWEYWNDNGADAYVSVAISTGGERPTSGSGFVEATGTQSAELVSMVQLGKTGAEASQSVFFILDHLLIDDVQINDWP